MESQEEPKTPGLEPKSLAQVTKDAERELLKIPIDVRDDKPDKTKGSLEIATDNITFINQTVLTNPAIGDFLLRSGCRIVLTKAFNPNETQWNTLMELIRLKPYANTIAIQHVSTVGLEGLEETIESKEGVIIRGDNEEELYSFVQKMWRQGPVVKN